MSVQLPDASIGVLSISEQRQAVAFFDFCVGDTARDHIVENDIIWAAKFCSGRDLPEWKASKLLLSMGVTGQNVVTRHVFLMYLASTKVLISRGTASAMMAIPEGMLLRDMMDVVQRTLTLEQMMKGGSHRDTALQHLSSAMEDRNRAASSHNSARSKADSCHSPSSRALLPVSLSHLESGKGRTSSHGHNICGPTQRLVRQNIQHVLRARPGAPRPTGKHACQAAHVILDVVEKLQSMPPPLGHAGSMAESDKLDTAGSAAEPLSCGTAAGASLHRTTSIRRTASAANRTQRNGKGGVWDSAARVVRLTRAAAEEGNRSAMLSQKLAQAEEGKGIEQRFVETQFEFADFQDPLLCFVRAQVSKRKAGLASEQELVSEQAGTEAAGEAELGQTRVGHACGGAVSVPSSLPGHDAVCYTEKGAEAGETATTNTPQHQRVHGLQRADPVYTPAAASASSRTQHLEIASEAVGETLVQDQFEVVRSSKLLSWRSGTRL